MSKTDKTMSTTSEVATSSDLLGTIIAYKKSYRGFYTGKYSRGYDNRTQVAPHEFKTGHRFDDTRKIPFTEEFDIKMRESGKVYTTEVPKRFWANTNLAYARLCRKLHEVSQDANSELVTVESKYISYGAHDTIDWKLVMPLGIPITCVVQKEQVLGIRLHSSAPNAISNLSKQIKDHKARIAAKKTHDESQHKRIDQTEKETARKEAKAIKQSLKKATDEPW